MEPPSLVPAVVVAVAVNSVLVDVHESFVVDGRLRMTDANGVGAEDHGQRSHLRCDEVNEDF